MIKNTLQDIEKYLGIPVKIVHLTEKLVVIMKQEMEQEQNSPVNRAFVKDDKIVEVFTGNLICVRQEGSEFCSIEDVDVGVIRKYLKPVFDLDGQLIIQRESNNL